MLTPEDSCMVPRVLFPLGTRGPGPFHGSRSMLIDWRIFDEGLGSSSLRCSLRDGKPSGDETITPCGLFVALLRSPSVPERAASSRDGSRVIRGSGTLSTTGLALLRSTMLAAVPSTPLCAFAVTATHVLSDRSAIGCSMSPARCFATAANLTPHWKAKKMLAKG